MFFRLMLSRSRFPRFPRLPGLLSAGLALTLLVGCSGRPGRVKQPRINASRAGSDALELYDTDGDGIIAGAELDATPPLKNELKLIDTDGDGGISADEIAARVNAWKAQKSGLLTLRCRIALDGKPAAGVLVEYEPEPFLADYLGTAVGTTKPRGSVSISIPKDQRPTADTPPGVPMGFYRVRITSTEGKPIPARYNTETILGHRGIL